MRVLDFPPVRLDPVSSRSGYIHDPDLGWFPPINTVRKQTASRTVTIATNSLGLRDIELGPRTQPTILFLGDSYVWGFNVEAEERFTERLRAMMPGVRMVNAGVAGYGTDQEYLLLRRLWPRIEPSTVVLIFCNDNDRGDNSTNYRNRLFKPYLTNVADGWQFQGQPVPKAPRQYFYGNWFVEHFASVRLALLAYSAITQSTLTIPDPTEQLVSMMRNLVEARGAKFLVGLQHEEPALEAFLNSQRIPYTRFDDAELYSGWRHWTPAGHSTVAGRLRELLLQPVIAPAAARQQ